MKFRTFFSYFIAAFSAWNHDKVSVWAAALSYYTVFSLSPLLLVVIGIAGIVFGTQSVQMSIFHQIRGLIGHDGASLLETMVQRSDKTSTGILATIIGGITLLLGASGVFGQLQEALNHIWNVEPKPDAGIFVTLRNRVLSFSMVIVIAFLLLVPLIISALITGISTFFSQLLPLSGVLLESLNFLISFAIISILFMLLFKQLPDVKLRWRDVAVGGVVTAFLFVIGKTAIGLYLGEKSFTSTYGAAASLVILLLWVYYIAQILFYGAEFTKVYVTKREGGIIPESYAMVKEPDKGKQIIQENVIDAAVKGYLKEKVKEKQKKKPKKQKK